MPTGRATAQASVEGCPSLESSGSNSYAALRRWCIRRAPATTRRFYRCALALRGNICRQELHRGDAELDPERADRVWGMLLTDLGEMRAGAGAVQASASV
jgi:hypothetical protein